MHRELEQWIEDLMQPQTELSNNSATDDTVPPPSEDWIHIKPVPSSISNLQQTIPEWMPTQPDEPQMTTNEQGLPQRPAEVDGIPSAPLSDGSQLGTDESEASREKEAGGDQEAMEGRGEDDVALTATVSNDQGGDEGVASTASEQGGDEGVASTASERGEDEGVASTASEQGGDGVSSAAGTGKLNWNSLGEAKRRFNYDILPKVCSN